MLDLRQLRYFVVVAEEEHVGRAAERLLISQSPLSRQIAKLEKQLGLNLFERAQQRISLTSDGRIFLAEARAVIRHADRLENLGRRLGRGEEGGLCIGYEADAMHTGVLPKALRTLRQEKPDTHVALYGLSAPEQFEGLRQRSLDIALVSDPPPADDPDLCWAKLLEDPLMLVLPADHPLARKESLLPGELHQQPWIAIENKERPGWRTSFLASCVNAGFTPDIRLETTDPLTALGLVASGLGAAMIQRSALRGAPDGVLVRELPWFALTEGLWAAWHQVDLRPLVAAFRATVLEQGTGKPEQGTGK